MKLELVPLNIPKDWTVVWNNFTQSEPENEAPYAKQVIVLNRTTIKVVFSEPVKNVNEPYFVMKEQGGDAVGISHDELNNTGAVVTEVTLKLSKDMMPGRVYYLTFNPGITDAAGFNGWKTKNGNEDISLLFTGI